MYSSSPCQVSLRTRRPCLRRGLKRAATELSAKSVRLTNPISGLKFEFHDHTIEFEPVPVAAVIKPPPITRIGAVSSR